MRKFLCDLKVKNLDTQEGEAEKLNFGPRSFKRRLWMLDLSNWRYPPLHWIKPILLIFIWDCMTHKGLTLAYEYIKFKIDDVNDKAKTGFYSRY